jgi:hypothetical protein
VLVISKIYREVDAIVDDTQHPLVEDSTAAISDTNKPKKKIKATPSDFLYYHPEEELFMKVRPLMYIQSQISTVRSSDV